VDRRGQPFREHARRARPGVDQRPRPGVPDGRRAIRLQATNERQAILARAGISKDKEVVVHCQAGIRTTLAVFALSLMGYDRVRAYDGSMAEWANREDVPLVRETASVP
jgi:thiosulfate/3-mercaptopyruvate sulfurtransferase